MLPLNNFSGQTKRKRANKEIYIPDVFDVMMSRRKEPAFSATRSRKNSYENVARTQRILQGER